MLPKIYQCPSSIKHACKWEGLSENIVDHFNNHHEKLIWFTNTIPVDLNRPLTPENYLVFIETELYLFQVKTAKENLNLFLRILAPNAVAQQKKFDIDLESNGKALDKIHIHKKSNCFEISLKSLEECFGQLTSIDCVVSITESKPNEKDASKFIRSFSEYHPEKQHKKETSTVTYQNINSIKEQKGLSRSYTLGIEHLKNNPTAANKRQINALSSTPETNAADPDDVRCANCKLNLFKPIFLCESTHNICESCARSNKSDCNLCNRKITKQRNFPLEDKLKNALYICRNKCNGCNEKLHYKDILVHENSCTFSTYICPIECGFKSTYKSMVNHLNLIHKSVKMYESFFASFSNYMEVFLVQERCNGIFYCRVQADDEKVCWIAKFAGNSNRKFFCELRFKHKQFKTPFFLSKYNDVYMLEMKQSKLKELKVKWKNSILTIS